MIFYLQNKADNTVKLSMVSAVTKILLGIRETSLALEAILLVMPVLPINSSAVGGPTICKHIIFVVQNRLCLAEAVHRLVYVPGSWWTELPKCSNARLEAEGRALKCVQSISLSVRTKPSHAKLYWIQQICWMMPFLYLPVMKLARLNTIIKRHGDFHWEWSSCRC